MAGVFLSYSRSDHQLAEQIIRGLRRIGVEVWWDQDMPGVDWQEELARELDAMAAVAVIWTPNSVGSKYVKDEARLGLKHEKLVNVMVGADAPPFPFDRVNGLPIDNWDGATPHGGWTRVVQTIESLAVQAGSAKPGEIMARLRQSEQDLRANRTAVVEAEQAFHEAQLREGEATEADDAARAARERAEADLSSIRATPVGPAILRAAQQEFDSADTAALATAKALRAARAELSIASRAVGHARAELEAQLAETPPPPVTRAQPSRKAKAALPIEPPIAADEPEPDDAIAEAVAAPPPIAPEPIAQPAMRATPAAAKAAPAARRAPLAVWLAPVGLLALVLLVVIVQAVSHPHASQASANETIAAASAATASSEAMASATTATAMSSDVAAAPPASPLVGSWSVAGLGCGSPVTFSETDGVLKRTFDGATVTVTQADAADFAAPDGARYVLGGNGALSMLSPGAAKAMRMTKCDN